MPQAGQAHMLLTVSIIVNRPKSNIQKNPNFVNLYSQCSADIKSRLSLLVGLFLNVKYQRS